MNLHLGSGNRYLSGWANVDLYAEQADIRADLLTVEFPTGCAERIRCIHTIEHIRYRDGLALLQKCADWLAPDGTLEIETPDRRKCLLAIKDGAHMVGAKGLLGGRSRNKPEWDEYLERWGRSPRARQNRRHYRIDSAWRFPGEEHLCVWTGEELADELRKLGLMVTLEKPQYHGRREWRDTRVVGLKP